MGSKKIKRLLPKDEWPYALQINSQVKGICVNGCALASISNLDENYTIAHAHRIGWICFKNEADINHPVLVIHEVSHLMTFDDSPHGFKWMFQYWKLIKQFIKPFLYWYLSDIFQSSFQTIEGKYPKLTPIRWKIFETIDRIMIKLFGYPEWK